MKAQKAINSRNYDIVMGLNMDSDGLSGRIKTDDSNFSFSLGDDHIALEDGRRQLFLLQSAQPLQFPKVSVTCDYDFSKSKKMVKAIVNNKLVRKVTNWAANKLFEMVVGIVKSSTVKITWEANTVTQEMDLTDCGYGKSISTSAYSDLTLKIRGDRLTDFFVGDDGGNLEKIPAIFELDGYIDATGLLKYEDSSVFQEYKGVKFNGSSMEAERIKICADVDGEKVIDVDREGKSDTKEWIDNMVELIRSIQR